MAIARQKTRQRSLTEFASPGETSKAGTVSDFWAKRVKSVTFPSSAEDWSEVSSCAILGTGILHPELSFLIQSLVKASTNRTGAASQVTPVPAHPGQTSTPVLLYIIVGVEHELDAPSCFS